MTNETAALLAELGAPQIIDGPSAQAAALAFLTAGDLMHEQAGKWLRLARKAEIAETDPQVRAAILELMQVIGGLTKQLEEAESRLQGAGINLRSLAEDLGPRIISAAIAPDPPLVEAVVDPVAPPAP